MRFHRRGGNQVAIDFKTSSLSEFEERKEYFLDGTKEAKSLLIALLLRDRVIG